MPYIIRHESKPKYLAPRYPLGLRVTDVKNEAQRFASESIAIVHLEDSDYQAEFHTEYVKA